MSHVGPTAAGQIQPHDSVAAAAALVVDEEQHVAPRRPDHVGSFLSPAASDFTRELPGARGHEHDPAELSVAVGDVGDAGAVRGPGRRGVVISVVGEAYWVAAAGDPPQENAATGDVRAGRIGDQLSVGRDCGVPLDQGVEITIVVCSTTHCRGRNVQAAATAPTMQIRPNAVTAQVRGPSGHRARATANSGARPASSVEVARRYPIFGSVSMTKAPAASDSDRRRSRCTQRFRASSPTARPRQHRAISASRETGVPEAWARATSTCMTRGCSRTRTAPLTTSHPAGRTRTSPKSKSATRGRSTQPPGKGPSGTVTEGGSSMIGN